MVEKIKSAWWIVYMIDENNEPKYLLVKRHALSKRVEWIAPKWKIQPWETMEQAAIREIGEETGLAAWDLQIKQKLDTLSLQLYNDQWKLWVDKDITYFLTHYTGDPDAVSISDTEGFVGYYKWATIREVLWLVVYKDIRELFRTWHGLISTINVRDNFLKNF